MHYVIGIGGVGTLLLPQLIRSTKDNIVLIDGDKFEEKNLDRQLFSPTDVGKNKAQAMVDLYASPQLSYIPTYFDAEDPSFKMYNTDTIWCCADNHPARASVLNVCDRDGCSAIIGANETTDAEAYLYKPKWRGTNKDPRVYYPRILTDRSGNPLRPHCIEEYSDNPQLVMANGAAATLMLHLFWFYENRAEELGEDTEEHWPIHHNMNVFKFTSMKVGEK